MLFGSVSAHLGSPLPPKKGQLTSQRGKLLEGIGFSRPGLTWAALAFLAFRSGLTTLLPHELKHELIKTHMTQKPLLRAEERCPLSRWRAHNKPTKNAAAVGHGVPDLPLWLGPRSTPSGPHRHHFFSVVYVYKSSKTWASGLP